MNMNFKSILISAVSGSKLVTLLKETEAAKEFNAYLEALNTTLKYEGKRSNIALIKGQFDKVCNGSIEPNEFVKWLGVSSQYDKPIQGTTLLSVVKKLASKKLD